LDSYRKLIILGVNKLLEDNLISLTSTNDTQGHIFADLGGHPSVIVWNGIGFGELRISVWWKYDHSKHPQANLTGSSEEKFLTSQPLAKPQDYPNFVGVTVSAWLERKTGKHIQGKGHERLFDIYTRRGEKAELDDLLYVEPNGYDAEGKFFL
jgi:hypothetical protein